MEDRLPTNRKASGVDLGLASVGAVLGAPSLIFTFFGSGAFAQLSGIFLALAAATVMNWIRSYSLTGFDGGLQPERLRMLGLASVAGATAFGALHLAIEIAFWGQPEPSSLSANDRKCTTGSKGNPLAQEIG